MIDPSRSFHRLRTFPTSISEFALLAMRDDVAVVGADDERRDAAAVVMLAAHGEALDLTDHLLRQLPIIAGIRRLKKIEIKKREQTLRIEYRDIIINSMTGTSSTLCIILTRHSGHVFCSHPATHERQYL